MRIYNEEEWLEQQPPPPPTPADECAGRGHPYYEDDWIDSVAGSLTRVGRCYCGAVIHPLGGAS